MRIIAYTYDADVHCVSCAVKQFAANPESGQCDEHGLPMGCEDSEGNPVHPVFSTDEQLEPLFCGDCRKEIK